MEKLWAPWRMRYVAGPKQDGCVFCSAAALGDDRTALVLYRGADAFLILNLYPYNSGHAMAVPYQHAAELQQLTPATRAELIELTELFTCAARSVFACDGFNIGLNVGEVAGAGAAEHLHIHAVPRWLGDANFMPIIANTTVMPELLPVTYARLRAEIERVVVERAGEYIPSSGAVVILPEARAVVLRRAANGDIVIPKGRIEPGESAADAALREVREETGVEARITGWVGSHTFHLPDDPAGRPRHVSFFSAAGQATPELARHLESDTLLVPLDELIDALTLPAQRDIARRAMPDLLHILEASA